MPVYKGELSLINFNDGNAEGEAGVGIKSTQVYYAASESGTTPPDLEGVALITDANQLLSFAEISTTFHVKNESLYAIKDNKEIGLSTDKGYIVGIAGWGTTIPDVAPGNYLWTKTVFIFTDDSQSVTYTVAKQGEKGDRGESSSTYKLKLNQTEVLKFVDKHGEMSVSPEILTVQIVEEEKTLEPFLESFVIQVRNMQTQAWLHIPRTVLEIENSVLKIDLKTLLELSSNATITDEAIQQFANQETVLLIQYTQIGEDLKEYIISEYLSVRYGMNRDMASLSLEANGLVSSIQSTKLSFNANGLTVQNGGLKILNNEEEQVFYADENGNLHIIGNITATNGEFTGVIHATDGEFVGKVIATEGDFTGTIHARGGEFTGEIQAKGGSIGGFDIHQELEGDKLVARLSSQAQKKTYVLINELTKDIWEKGSYYVKNNGEYSLSTEWKEQETYYSLNSSPYIVLDGHNGFIEAENITLGTGAKIKDYLQLGENVQLRSILNNDQKFIVVNYPGTERETFAISGEGIMTVGPTSNQIIIDGPKGQIYSGNYNNFNGWSISNEEAIFNNITAKGSIKASVLEYGEVQAVGGIVLIRPSSKISSLSFLEDENKTLVYLERAEGFNVGEVCLVNKEFEDRYQEIELAEEDWKTKTYYLLVDGNYVLDKNQNYRSDLVYYLKVSESRKEYFTIIESLPEEKFIVVEGEVSQDYIGNPIVNLGTPEKDEYISIVFDEGVVWEKGKYYLKDGQGAYYLDTFENFQEGAEYFERKILNTASVGVGINASTNGNLLTPESLSVFELKENNELDTKIILGKIPENTNYGYAAGSYGLYAENVLLKGSLVTQTLDSGGVDTYSGISTIYKGANAPTSRHLKEQFGDKTGEILIWAGAKGTTKEDIESSKFFVDRNGNLYAGSGYFKGTIITDATITASEIKTATLTGNGTEDSEFALTIKDVAKGIVFLQEDKEIFALQKDLVSFAAPIINLNSSFRINNENFSLINGLYVVDEVKKLSENGSSYSNIFKISNSKISYLQGLSENNLGILEEQGEELGSLDFSQGVKIFNRGEEILETNLEEIKTKKELNIANSAKYTINDSTIMEYKPVYDSENQPIGFNLFIY